MTPDFVARVTIAAFIALAFLLPAIAQDPAYHRFADQRSWLGIPNAANVLSNLALVAAGVFGAVVLLSSRRAHLRNATAISVWCAAVGFILSRQNRDGGFGTYERRRGGRLIERLNPSEMFGQCMTEQSYLECTASAIRALQLFLHSGLAEDPAPVLHAINRAVKLVLSRQRADGSWLGFWGINFIYGTLFAVNALRCAGLAAEDPALDRAHRWLCSVQREDGGWSEHFSSCLSKRYVANPTSLIISTAWAVLALLDIETEPSEATRRGVDWLVTRQGPAGDWPRDSVNGVFFGTAMLDYRLYNTYFPTWALARFEACRHAAER